VVFQLVPYVVSLEDPERIRVPQCAKQNPCCSRRHQPCSQAPLWKVIRAWLWLSFFVGPSRNKWNLRGLWLYFRVLLNICENSHFFQLDVIHVGVGGGVSVGGFQLLLPVLATHGPERSYKSLLATTPFLFGHREAVPTPTRVVGVTPVCTHLPRSIYIVSAERHNSICLCHYPDRCSQRGLGGLRPWRELQVGILPNRQFNHPGTSPFVESTGSLLLPS